MKKIILIILILLVALFQAQSLTQTENYLYERTYLEPVTSEQPGALQMQTVQYLDGLGRNIQTTAIKASPSGKDLTVPILYDADGKRTKSFLPLPVDTQNGAYLSNINESSVNTYYGISNAYSEVTYEKSPLGRPQKSAAPGTDWQMSGTHTRKIEYLFNSGNDVKRFQATTTWNPSTLINDVSLTLASDDNYTAGGYYKANTLLKYVTIDEDGNQTHTYTNGNRQKVLMRQVNKKPNGTIENLDTYYVYDEFGNLSFIIPPKASVSTVTTTVLDQLCYQYKYDKYNRQVEKKLPGKDWVYIVYDQQNRMVASQDANLRVKAQWLYTKYDQLGRVAITGISTGASTANARAYEQALADQKGLNNVNRIDYVYFNRQGMDVYYDNPEGTYPASPNWVSLLSVNYYDTYPAGSPSQPTQIQNQATLASIPATIVSNGLSSVRSTKTLATANYIKNIEDDNWTSAFIWYDTLGRMIGSHSTNHLGGYTKTEAGLDFTGVALQTKTYHKRLNTDTEKVITETFEYDNQKRLKKHYHQVGSQPVELLAENIYNDLSQLVNKKVGNNLQSIDYSYNIRGWLTKINDPQNLNGKLFGYEVKYTNAIDIESRYNGNISQIDWKTANDGVLRRYSYRYDPTNRLTSAYYHEPNSSVPYNHFYNEEANYDLNGNITQLLRNSKNNFSGTAELIDNLTYTYTGNRLTSVTDGSGNYSGYPDISGNIITYDDNGNMKDHKDKGILQMDYNLLNLLDHIKFNDTYIIRNLSTGEDELRNVRTDYLYRADGTKLRKKYTYFFSKNATERVNTTDYLDGFQYTISYAGVVSLDFVPTSEGYYDFKNNRYIYNYIDHLGNVRLSYYNNGLGAVALEENNYYPFGLKHEGYNNQGGLASYQYKYNNKELQLESGMLDYGWRQYMPELGRWNGIDQLAEKYHFASPYAYVLNNPINMFDPDGRDIMAIVQAMWEATPDGTNSYWSNQGDHFVSYNGGSPGGSGSLAYGSTVSLSGAFSPGSGGGGSGGGGGSISLGGGAFSYMYNGERHVFLPTLYLTGHKSSWASQFQSHLDKFWNNVTSTNTFGSVKNLVPENYLIKAENEISTTKGRAGILNLDFKNTKNFESMNSSIDMQLSWQFWKLNHEVSKDSYSNGATISIGDYSIGVSATTAFDILNSDLSMKFEQKLDQNSTSTNTYGIKPVSAAAAIVGYIMGRYLPPSVYTQPVPASANGFYVEPL